MLRFMTEIFYGTIMIAIVVMTIVSLAIMFLIGLISFPPLMLLAVAFLILACNVLGKVLLTWLDEK